MENNESCSCKKCNLGSLLAGILVFALVAGGAYFLWNMNSEKNELKEQIKALEEKVDYVDEEEVALSVEVKDEEQTEESKEEVLEEPIETLPEYPADTFSADKDGNYFGKLTVSGYPTVKMVPQAFCDPEVDDGCTSFPYVYFNLVGNLSPEFQKFSDTNAGNAFVGQDVIGLGCKENGPGFLYYYNDSEENGMKYFRLSDEDSVKLFAGTMNSPVTITLERKPFYGGSGAPECYSHFTEITVY
ncbi:MAG: hypothetical protein RBS56_00410 [Candidatus Gracilibacteria bacterium]|jgi:hypothetical protein|nr:hypothetical protein [Candidatus Gracilibacteria bacterium]